MPRGARMNLFLMINATVRSELKPLYQKSEVPWAAYGERWVDEGQRS